MAFPFCFTLSLIVETMIDRVIVNDINLAAALATIGVKPLDMEDGSPPFVKIQTKNGLSYNFFFEPTHEGKNTQDYVTAWYDDSYIENNQEDQFAAIKGYNINRNYMLDVVKQSSPLIIMNKGKKTVYMQNLSEEQTKQVLGRI